MQDLARHAAGVLGRLYGTGGTYSSWGARLRIAEAQGAISDVRRYFGMPALG